MSLTVFMMRLYSKSLVLNDCQQNRSFLKIIHLYGLAANMLLDLKNSQKHVPFKWMQTPRSTCHWYCLIFNDKYKATTMDSETLEFSLSKSLLYFPLIQLQGFKNKPQVFITVQHKHTDRPYDSMNLWLEDVKKNEFHICMREFMAFDGIHSDLKVVCSFQNLTINGLYYSQTVMLFVTKYYNTMYVCICI